jgi:hypothetical protein
MKKRRSAKTRRRAHARSGRVHQPHSKKNPLHILVKKDGSMVIADGLGKGARVTWGIIGKLFDQGGVKFRHQRRS